MLSVGSISNLSFTNPGPMNMSDNLLLFLTLALALISLFCSAYTTLRTLLLLLPPHPLTRRTTGSAVGPYEAPPAFVPEKKPRLKSAQRFTVWLAAIDIIAACVMVWESALAVSGENGLGGSKAGAARLYVCCTARPTLLLVVAVLSYANVVQGRSIALGTLDWIVWAPALCILGLGTGLASIAPVGGVGAWIGLIVWLTVVTAIVSLCFGRLLVAILRVRKSTQRHQATSPWAQEQERFTRDSHSSAYRTPASYLPPMHTNFSGLTASFCHTVGRSVSTLDLSTSDPKAAAGSSEFVLSFSSAIVPAVGYAPSRPSEDELSSDWGHGHGFRSPTPGSTMGLLASRGVGWPSSPISAPSSAHSQTPRAVRKCDSPSHETISFEDLPRPSFGSYASPMSTGGLVGGTAVRQAISREVWGSERESPMPGSGSPKVELSQKEARGAVTRIGGHLLCSLFGYALVAPFLFLRLSNPTADPPLVTSILLVASVCQPGLVLAIQTALSEGLFFRTQKPPVLTSSSAAHLEHRDMASRPGSRASSVYPQERPFSPVPGIEPSGVDCDERKMSRMGRTMSIAYPHPKLLVLPMNQQSSHGISKRPTPVSVGASTHQRLRSLTLARRKRSESTASRATVAGFEHQHESPAKTRTGSRGDQLLTRALLTASSRNKSFAGDGRVPFGFGSASRDDFAAHKKRTPSLSPITTPTTADSEEFSLLRTREFTLSPPPTPISPAMIPSPTDYAIDFLSSKLIPRLVPGTKVGKDTPVDCEYAPLNSHRVSGSLSSIGHGRPPTGMGSARNRRNLSLPGISSWTTFSKSEDERDETWIEVDAGKEVEPTPIAAITRVVRAAKGRGGDKSLRRRSWKDRTAKAWDRVEEGEKVSGVSTGATFRAETSAGKRSAPRLAAFEERDEVETEVLDFDREFVDVSSGDEDDEVVAQAEVEAHRRATSPRFDDMVSPPAVTFGRRPRQPTLTSESVVLRGSQFVEDKNSGELGVVQCATIRPISRLSDISFVSPNSRYSLRPTYSVNISVNSTRSFASSNERSITAEGFRNVMEVRSWHGRDDSGLSSGDESGPDAIPRRTSGLRPLALLARRASSRSQDTSSASDKESDKESKKKERPSKANDQRRPSFTIPTPPAVPATIEEADEDKRSGTPTPKDSRHRSNTIQTVSLEETRRSILQYLTDLRTPMSSTPPPSSSRTPPAPYSPDAHITSRTRAREQQVNAVRRTGPRRTAPAPPTDENIAPSSAAARARWPAVDASGSAHASIRAIR